MPWGRVNGASASLSILGAIHADCSLLAPPAFTMRSVLSQKATADIKRARTLRIATARQRGIAVLRQSVYEQMPEAAEQFLASTTIRLLSFMFSSHARIGAINLIRLDDFLNANKPNVSFVRCFEIFLARTRP
jgi:hypothetical protein